MLFSQSLCSPLSGTFGKFLLTSKPPTTSAFDTTTQPLRKGNIKAWFDRRNRNYLKQGKEKKVQIHIPGKCPTLQGTLWLPSANPAPCPQPGPPLPRAVALTLRPCDSGKADTISFISPSPQAQHKAGLWGRKFQIPFSASPCPQLCTRRCNSHE